MTDTQDFPPDWAIEEALTRARSTWITAEIKKHVAREYSTSILAHARTIAQHEQPPEDPDLAEAREIAAAACDRIGMPNTANRIRRREEDDSPYVQPALDALKRGRELAHAR